MTPTLPAQRRSQQERKPSGTARTAALFCPRQYAVLTAEADHAARGAVRQVPSRCHQAMRELLGFLRKHTGAARCMGGWKAARGTCCPSLP